MKNALPRNGHSVYQVGEFQLNTEEHTLLRGGDPISITPKMFDVLWLLVQNQGRIVGKEELLQAVWSDSFVEEANITVTIGQLRKVLGDSAQTPSYIQTVARRGYRFVAPVEKVHDDTEPEPDATPRVNGNGDSLTRKLAPKTNGNGHKETSHNGKSAEWSDSPVMIQKRRFRWAPVLIAVAILSVAAGGFYLWQNRTRTIAARLTNLRAERLTDTGNTAGASISPDGKLIAYSTIEGGQSVIWLRHLATGKSIQIVPPSGEMVSGVSFSNDGEYVDYFHSAGGAFNNVSRISILGGPPTRILSKVHGSYSFSPDGKKIAFTRFQDHSTTISIANADGTDEQTILTPEKGRTIISVDWAPDGSSLAYTVGKFMSRDSDVAVMEYEFESQRQRPLTEFRWNELEAVMWLPDKSGLLASGRNTLEAIHQIWLISLPQGDVRQISFDSSSLKLRGATSDFSKLLAQQKRVESKLWIGLSDDPAAAKDISSGAFDVALTRDGSVVFTTADTLTTDIWISNSDGTGRRQLTNNPAVERSPAVSPDGRFIVYAASLDGKQTIWRMNTDGTDPVELTAGGWPTFTANGRSVLFNSLENGNVMRVPIEGGQPVLVFNGRAMRPTVSPDGESFAYYGIKDNVRMLFVRKLDGGEIVKEIAIPGRPVTQYRPRWTADGKAMLINVSEDTKVGNIFRVRLDGSPAEKLTDFTSDVIFDFDLSGDGSRMALVRGSWKYDTILFSGFD